MSKHHPQHHFPRILFILKKRLQSSGWTSKPGEATSSGLYNSAQFIVDMLRRLKFDVDLVEVTDANDIDREVNRFRPTHTIIEAIWVPPAKFKELTKLHPKIHWVIRTHSEIPFLANEGMAIKWLLEYVQFENVAIAANSERALRELRLIVHEANPEWNDIRVKHKVVFLPNYYPVIFRMIGSKPDDNVHLNVGCFGAIRPMKNQLIQAVAAVEAANQMNKKLRFHVNASRIEQGGENILKNLQALMHSTGNELVRAPWMNHDDFVAYLRQMDLSMQVSFSETFNIVAADSVMADVPIVVSPEIDWASQWCQADPTNSKAIANTILLVLNWKFTALIMRANFKGLKKVAEDAQEEWLCYLHQVHHPRRHFGY